jgi:hypothetical protein
MCARLFKASAGGPDSLFYPLAARIRETQRVGSAGLDGVGGRRSFAGAPWTMPCVSHRFQCLAETRHLNLVLFT